jgi:hypothetical protein
MPAAQYVGVIPTSTSKLCVLRQVVLAHIHDVLSPASSVVVVVVLSFKLVHIWVMLLSAPQCVRVADLFLHAGRLQALCCSTPAGLARHVCQVHVSIVSPQSQPEATFLV